MTLTVQQMTRNILSVYRLATREDIDNGLQWYPQAHSIVCDWAKTFNRSIGNVASVIAALSPQISWERNLIVADDLLHGNAPSIGGCLFSNIRKAELVRDEHHNNLLTAFKQGCKVNCFAANLAGNYDVVTVDTHGAQTASGDVCNTLRVDTWQRYEPVARAYIDASQRISPVTSGRKHLESAFLQAITWHTWKRIYPPAHKRNERRSY